MKPKLLIVDDSRTARLTVADAFQGFECELLEARNAIEGLATARREKPDLVLLDIDAPGTNGFEMLARFQSDAVLRNTPVTVLSSDASRQVVMKVARLGVKDYLVKPFTEATLVDRVGRIVNLPAKGETAPVRRFEDPISILVVDDKPAILEQIKQALSDTTWQVEGRSQLAEAQEFCAQTVPDLVVVSLALPENGAFALLKHLRATGRTRKVPVFGLIIKTAVQEQERALEAGFGGVVTKPILAGDLKTQIARKLKLDTSGRYFEEQQGVLILRIPEQTSGEMAAEILEYFPKKVAAAVEAGLDKMLLDLSQLKQPGPGLMTMAMSAIRICEELTLDYRIVGSEAVTTECKKHEESKNWKFASSCEEALALWSLPESMPV